MWLSPIKINTHLRILEKLENNYHSIQSRILILDTGDNLSFEILPSQDIRLTMNENFSLIPEKNNLAYQAAYNLQKYASVKQGVHIKIDKKIPIQSGLGGGSSNAAITLIALNQLWKCNLSSNQLCEAALHLGEDVNIFLAGQPTLFIEGTGKKITPLSLPKEPIWIAIIVPMVSCSTQFMYQHPLLSRNQLPWNIENINNIPYVNDFELLATQLHPEIKNCIAYLRDFGMAQMSGTGSACFCITSEFTNAQNAINFYPYLSRWKIVARPWGTNR